MITALITVAVIFFGFGLLTGFELYGSKGSGGGGSGPTPTPTTTTAPPTTQPPTNPPTTNPPTTQPPTSPPPTTIPPTNPALDSTGNYIACPNTPDTSGPSGNTFSGHTYNGNHTSLNIDVAYVVGSNTCIENFNFTRGQLVIQNGASNVYILNNKFNGWPASSNGQGRAIDGLLSGGSNIVINYNNFASPVNGTPWTGIYGRGGIHNLTVTHNNWSAMNVDDMQINCVNTCYDINVMYNRMVQSGRFVVENQQLVHNEHWAYNYADVNFTTARTGGQVSIAHSNDLENSSGFANDISSGIEVDHNIVIDANKAIDFGDCFESRGPGNNFHDNYCWGYAALDDYAFTSPQNFNAPNSWKVTNNTVVGSHSGALSIWEGFERSGYTQVPATETGNTRLSYTQQPTPQPPAWSYANGAQW